MSSVRLERGRGAVSRWYGHWKPRYRFCEVINASDRPREDERNEPSLIMMGPIVFGAGPQQRNQGNRRDVREREKE